MRTVIVLLVAVALATVGTPAYAATVGIRVAPKSIDFGIRHVGPTYYDDVKITNSSGRAVRMLVEPALPDDFGFGLLPGSTCPALTPGELMSAGESCRAVVRFTPFSVGWKQTGSLIVRATDPSTGAPVAEATVPVSGTGKL